MATPSDQLSEKDFFASEVGALETEQSLPANHPALRFQALREVSASSPLPDDHPARFFRQQRDLANGFSELREPGKRPPIEQAEGVYESFVAGLQTSTSGLAVRQELPEIVVAQNADTAERLAAMVGTVLGDMPTLVVGAMGGSVGGAVGGPVGAAAGAGAGAFALTEAAREWMLLQFEEGKTRKDVSERLTATAFAAGKGAVIGGLTGGVGAKVGKVVGTVVSPVGPVAPLLRHPVNRFATVTTAEVATMVTTASALEGELPDPQSFMDAAILLGGLKTAVPVSAKLKIIFKRTGKKPEEVAAMAEKDSGLWQDLIDETAPAISDKLYVASESPLRINPQLLGLAERTQKPGVAENRVRELDPATVDALLNPMAHLRADKRTPANLNLDTFDLKDGPKQLADALSSRFEADILVEQGGRVSLSQTDVAAAALLKEMLGEKGLYSVFEPGSVKWAAELRARKEILVATLDTAWQKATEINKLKESGQEASPEMLLDFMSAVERARKAQSVFRGRTAEAGRALQALKSTTRIKNTEIKQKKLEEALQGVGGRDAVEILIKMTGEINDPVALAKTLRKPTVFEMITEGWKSMLLSGPTTHEVNFFGNILFAATRVPEEVIAASLSKLHFGGKDRIAYTDALFLTTGLLRGSFDSIRLGAKVTRLNVESKGFAGGLAESFKQIEVTRKGKQEVSSKIPGVFGEVVRTPFKLLTLGDILGRTMNYRASLNNLASRQARDEGLRVFSKPFMRRVEELTRNPPEKMELQARADETRCVCMESGPIIKALEQLRRDLPGLQFILPFLKAPGSIIRETVRRTPLSPFIRQWREDFAAGGSRRDRALAEVTYGTGIMVATFVLAQDGVITGGGHPDRKMREAQLNAGFQPYSIRMSDGRFISYNRLEPAGTLMGMAADLSQAWDLMESGEQDDAASALMWGATEVIKNKTWSKSMTAFLNGVTQPERFGGPLVESLASSFVPGALSQTAREMDPFLRETNSILDAVQARIPGLREDLPKRFDDFGEPIQANKGIFPTAPARVSTPSTDPVRLKAAELGVSAGNTPRTLRAGSIAGVAADVELTQEQRDQFARESGQLAHRLMKQAMNSPGFDQLNPLLQRRTFEKIFAISRRKAAIEVLPPEQRLRAMQELREENDL